VSTPLHSWRAHGLVDPAPAQAARVPWGAPAMGEQVPTSPGASQAAQPAVHEVLQQTPSTQNPVSHSVPAAQAMPSGFAQEPLVVGRSQRAPVAQLFAPQHTPSTHEPELHS
jgi:hypothetical protein